MVLGWDISPVWALVLWAGLIAFLTFFLYGLYFQPSYFWKSDRNFLQDFESAWWNRKVILWAVFIVNVVFLIPLFSTSVLSFFFKELQLPRDLPSDVMRNWASNDPVLWFIWTALDSALFSFFILVPYLAMSRPDRRIWVEHHFTFVLILMAAFFVALQTFGIFLNNFIAGNGP